MKLNCWEFKKCGREEGGANVNELGVCPAYTQNAGQACWLIAGTFCDGVVQGTFAQKAQGCTNCDFYKMFDQNHKSHMWYKFKICNLQENYN